LRRHQEGRDRTLTVYANLGETEIASSRKEFIVAAKQANRPPVPAGQDATLRQQIVALLQQRTVSAKDLSMAIGLPEKQVYHHLEHIRRSFQQQRKMLRIDPAVCKKCGFIFEKRQRFQKPGKCPVCRGQAIEEPRFSLPGSLSDLTQNSIIP
jgi:hypothetical protein